VPSRLPTAALLAALALGGCGGGDDTPAKIASKGDFIAAADKICVERDTASSKLAGVGSDADLARLSGQLAAIYDKAISDLKAVSLPPGNARAGARKYVQATAAMLEPVKRMEAASTKLEAAVKSKRATDLKAAGEQLQTSVNTVQVLGEVADQAARDYGMQNCGQAGTSNPVS
jgi:hypothetical protein